MNKIARIFIALLSATALFGGLAQADPDTNVGGGVISPKP